MPKELITQSELDELKLQHKPSFVPLTEDENAVKVFDSETGIAQRRLSNGISINYKVITLLFASFILQWIEEFTFMLLLYVVSFSFMSLMALLKIGL